MNRWSFLKGLFFISSIFTFKLSASSKNNVSFDFGVASGDPTNSSEVRFIYVNTVKSKVYEVIDSNRFDLRPNSPII